MYFSGRFYDRAQGAENTGLRFVLDIAPCIFPLFFRKVFSRRYQVDAYAVPFGHHAPKSIGL